MILRAAWVFPVSQPAIRDGYVELTADRIAGVGSYGGGSARGHDVIDLGDVILTPGLINPHAHLELGCYAGRLPRGPLWEWLRELIVARREPGQVERESNAVRAGAAAALAAGVTCIGDISRLNLAWRSLKESPIRKVCFAELLTLADAPPRNPAELREAIAQIAEDALLTAGISPHASHTVPAEYFAAAVRLAHELRRPWCTHWAETPEEIAFLAGDDSKLPPMFAMLARNAGVRPYRLPAGAALEAAIGCAGRDQKRSDPVARGALAHCNYVTDEDIERLSRHDFTVVYCPRAHDFYEHPPHPLPRLLDAGVRVALGTDSLAANESLSMLDEAAFVWNRVWQRGTAGGASAERLLRMITLDGAAALDMQDKIGSLEPGKLADLVAFKVPPALVGLNTRAENVLNALFENPPPAARAWVGGQQVVDGRA